MLLGALPKMLGNKQGDAIKMKALYERIYDFFVGVCRRNILFVQISRMTLFNKALKDSEEN